MANGQEIAKPSGEGLERKPEDFFSRLSEKEREMTQKIVGTLDDYMTKRSSRPFLVAGVGSVLRYENPYLAIANDIDLAVVGFKYTPGISESRGAHTFDHVISFTKSMEGYFEMLQKALNIAGVKSKGSGREPGRGRFAFSSTGPFKGLNQMKYLHLGEDQIGTLESDLETFGNYGSKGLHVCFEGLRPIDIQFLFNKTPAEWRADQYSLHEPFMKSSKFKSQDFPYAVLAEKK